jgi:hypothetical protein
MSRRGSGAASRRRGFCCLEWLCIFVDIGIWFISIYNIIHIYICHIWALRSDGLNEGSSWDEFGGFHETGLGLKPIVVPPLQETYIYSASPEKNPTSEFSPALQGDLMMCFFLTIWRANTLVFAVWFVLMEIFLGSWMGVHFGIPRRWSKNTLESQGRWLAEHWVKFPMCYVSDMRHMSFFYKYWPTGLKNPSDVCWAWDPW